MTSVCPSRLLATRRASSELRTSCTPCCSGLSLNRALAAAAGVDLGLDDGQPAAQFAEGVGGGLRRVGDDAPRHAPLPRRAGSAWPGTRGSSSLRPRRQCKVQFGERLFALPFPAEHLPQLGPGSRIGHVGLRQPAATGLQDAEPHRVQSVYGMRVGRNDNRHAKVLRRRAGHVVQVEPRRMGVELQELAVLARRRETPRPGRSRRPCDG